MLDLAIPQAPMEARSVNEIPIGSEWQYEPKWDGFRCLAFRNGTKIDLQSKSGQSLTRYFPEIVAALSELKPKQFVLDSELVVPEGKGFSFDLLLQRIHPAASRVKKLSEQHPAQMMVFDLLANEKGRSLLAVRLHNRRKMLEEFARRYFQECERIELSPATSAIAQARHWFNERGSHLDGVIAKRADLPYVTDNRSGMRKIKRKRTADCVVGGFRYGERKKEVGSLLLGLYDREGLLHHVGFCSSIKKEDRRELTRRLEALIQPPGFSGRAPGGPSRWSSERSMEWKPLQPKLVAEVEYDHVSGDRFRHGTRFLRWRPEKKAQTCTMDQIEHC